VETELDTPALAMADDSRRDGQMECSFRYATPEALFRAEHEKLVKALVLVADGDREAARDAVQEAYVQLCLNWKKVREYDDPSAWVRRVAINRLRNQQRSYRRGLRAVSRLAGERAATDSSPPPPTQDLRRERVLTALKALPERQRTAAALYYVADLSVAEVARSMGVREGSVKTHLSRARGTLKSLLEDER